MAQRESAGTLPLLPFLELNFLFLKKLNTFD
jgi:hypothetical protein